MKKNPKIKIPRGLASAIANHRGYIRVFACFSQLKSLDSSSRFNAYRKNLSELAEACKISTRTLETRISEMKLAGLVKIEGSDLILSSWDFVFDKFDLDKTRKKFWYYDADKIKCKLDYIFQFLAIKEVQLKMMTTYRLKLRDDAGHEFALKNILGIDSKQSITAQEHLAGVIQSFVRGGYNEGEVTTLSHLNPDDQVSVNYLRKFFGYGENSLSGPSYRKKILAKLGVVSIEKRSFESPHRARKMSCGTVNFNRKKNRTFLRLCDRICPAF